MGPPLDASAWYRHRLRLWGKPQPQTFLRLSRSVQRTPISTKTTRNGMYLSLQEGILVRGPQRLRSDWNRVGMLMNCIRFVEALGVSPGHFGRGFCSGKGNAGAFGRGGACAGPPARSFPSSSCLAAGLCPRPAGLRPVRENAFRSGGLFGGGRHAYFVPIVLGAGKILWRSAVKALTFCAEFRKNHRCVGILPPRTLPGREMKPFCPRNGANALGPWMVLCNTILA